MSFIKTLLIQGIPFGLVMGVTFSFMGAKESAVIGGFASALLFCGMMAFFSSKLQKKFAGRLSLENAEHLVAEGPANHMQRGEGVGGWLYLTNTRLTFVSHKANIQVHSFTAPFEEIIGVEPKRSVGILPNRLLVRTTKGDELFVVNDRAKWLEAFGN